MRIMIRRVSCKTEMGVERLPDGETVKIMALPIITPDVLRRDLRVMQEVDSSKLRVYVTIKRLDTIEGEQYQINNQSGIYTVESAVKAVLDQVSRYAMRPLPSNVTVTGTNFKGMMEELGILGSIEAATAKGVSELFDLRLTSGDLALLLRPRGRDAEFSVLGGRQTVGSDGTLAPVHFSSINYYVFVNTRSAEGVLVDGLQVWGRPTEFSTIRNSKTVIAGYPSLEQRDIAIQNVIEISSAGEMGRMIRRDGEIITAISAV